MVLLVMVPLLLLLVLLLLHKHGKFENNLHGLDF